ncbi:MAG: hypothetical protein HY898_26865 [Deltaproteobacteria bacterium]|nr:hypothetical protein [Deltaproteobacteria bacterium]
MALPLISTEPGKPGIIAIGGDAVGILAVGVSATGIIALGLQSRGLVAIACGASVGVFSVSIGASIGLFATSVGFAGGVLGGALGVELPVWPGPFPRRIRDTGEGSTEDMEPGTTRWLRVRLDRDGDQWKVLHRGSALRATIAQQAASSAVKGPARVLVALKRSEAGADAGQAPAGSKLEVTRIEPLTGLWSARALWVLSLMGRVILLSAIGWYLAH